MLGERTCLLFGGIGLSTGDQLMLYGPGACGHLNVAPLIANIYIYIYDREYGGGLQPSRKAYHMILEGDLCPEEHFRFCTGVR